VKNRRSPLCLVVLAAVLSACTGPADPPGTEPTGPEPSGHAQESTSEFDREPCAPASTTELAAALTEPFGIIAAAPLVPQGSPAVLSADEAGPGATAGCEYRLLAEGSDSSEAYHEISVRVVRLGSGGPELMSSCEDAAAAEPLRYRLLELADGACAGTGAVVCMLVGATYYSITAAAIPGRADQTDEELRLGTLAEAAGTVLADRLPAT